MLTYAQAAITQMGVGYGGGPRMTRTYVHAMEQVLSVYLLYSYKRCSVTCFPSGAHDAHVRACDGADAQFACFTGTTGAQLLALLAERQGVSVV
jgi:hypothetical protein